MDRTHLHEVADILTGLETGAWLKDQLAAESAPGTGPRVLLLVSARREFERAFPNGLKQEPGWVEWTGDGPPDASVVEQADLLLWGMAALAMFPGEYAASLEQARRERIPIWAIVVGLARLPEKEAFLRRSLPVHQASLPEYSEILVHQGANGDDLAERITQLLHERAAVLTQRGEARRLSHLAQSVLVRLGKERQALQAAAERAEQFATTADRGVAALKVRVEAAAPKMLEAYSPLHDELGRFLQEINEDVEVEREEVKVEELARVLQQQVGAWRGRTLEPEIERLTRQVQQRLSEWCQSYSEDLGSFFSPARGLIQDHQALKSKPALDSEQVLVQVAPLLDAIRSGLLKKYDRFARWLQHGLETAVRDPSTLKEESEYAGGGGDAGASNDQENAGPNRFARLVRAARGAAETVAHSVTGFGGGEELSAKQKVQIVLEARIQLLHDAFTEVIVEQRPRLSALLEQAIEEQGGKQRALIAPTVTDPQAKMAQMSEAERMLRRRFL